MDFTIQKGVPVAPSRRVGSGPKHNYPFDKMEVNDSFFVAAADTKKASRLQTALIAVAIKSLGKGNYTTRRTAEDGFPGVRVWRTK